MAPLGSVDSSQLLLTHLSDSKEFTPPISTARKELQKSLCTTVCMVPDMTVLWFRLWMPRSALMMMAWSQLSSIAKGGLWEVTGN